MDPASYCVYNVTRNALLSERIISVSEPQTPSQLLGLVMNGPARDPHFCIRLTNVSVVSDVPRLFAFDVAYLDAEQRILEIADVGPGTPFPALNEKVATILFLSDQLLARSSTEVGDFIRICTEAELAVLLRAAAQFRAVESPGWPIESSGPSNMIPPDPFAGSLIYLPSSGTPQDTEIFLTSHAPQPAPLDLKAAPIFEELPACETASATASPIETPPVNPSEIGPLPEFDAQEEEPIPPAAHTQPVTRFFETASQQPAPLPAPPVEAQPPASKPSQLPFSLKAVIQFVDDQLRREKQQQEQALPQKPPKEEKVLAANALVAESFASSEIEERPVELSPHHPSSAESEDSADLPLLSTEQVPELPEIDATAIDAPQPQLTEAFSLSEMASEEIAAVLPAPAPQQPQPSMSLESTENLEPVQIAAQPPPLSPVVEPSPAPLHETSPVPASLPPPSPPESKDESARIPRYSPKEKLPFATRVQRWLAGDSISLSGNRRRGERVALPGLVAFYFTGGAPKPHEIVNISNTGLYLRSKELWSPNTLVRMTLERQDAELGEKKTISVLARVVRIDDGGIGHEFVTTEVLNRLHARDFLPTQGTNRKELEKFLARTK